MIKDFNVYKLSKIEAEAAGVVGEAAQGVRLDHMAGVGQGQAHQNSFERFVDRSSKLFRKVNLSVYWNDFGRTADSGIAQQRTIDVLLSLDRGEKVSAKEIVL